VDFAASLATSGSNASQIPDLRPVPLRELVTPGTECEDAVARVLARVADCADGPGQVSATVFNSAI
jgi:hypothetical protein